MPADDDSRAGAAALPCQSGGALPPAAEPPTLYMRPLPPSCEDWQSAAGRVRFDEALASGTLERAQV